MGNGRQTLLDRLRKTFRIDYDDDCLDKWEGIELVTKSLDQQTESRIGMLLVNALLVFCITAGGMGIVLSAIDSDYQTWIVELVTLVASLYVAFLYYRKWWENVGYILLLVVVFAVGFGMQSYVSSGFYSVMNDLMESVSEYFQSNATRSYGEKIADANLAVTIAMSYIAVAASVVVNIFVSRKMRYRFLMLVVFGFLFLPLYVHLEPDMFYVVQFFVGVVVTAAIAKNGDYKQAADNVRYKQDEERIVYQSAYRVKLQAGACLLAVVAIGAVLFSLLVPSKDYHDRHPDSAWKQSTKDAMQNVAVLGIAGLFNFYDNTGGLTSGKLGGVSAVRLDYDTDLRVTFVPQNENRFYLRRFIGQDYLYGMNRWESAKAIYMRTEQRAKTAFEKNITGSAHGIVKVDNVAADPGLYMPYYSLQSDLVTSPGRSQTYDYYTYSGLDRDCKLQTESISNWLTVPDSSKAVLDEFCKEADLTGTVAEIVQKLAAYYQDNIPYTYQPGITPYGQDFVSYFLKKNRRGYCAHFASAATLLLRNCGIPARYVEGYAIDPEDIGENGKILTDQKVSDYYQGYRELTDTGVVQVDVTDANAHAWVEIYDHHKGWYVVDITPASDQEEADVSLWNAFMRLFRNRGNGTAQSNTGGTGATGTADAVEAVKRTGKVSLGVLALLLLIFVITLAVRQMIRILRCSIAYHRADTNDRLIADYQRYVRKIGHKYPAFQKQTNYETQIAWLRKQRLLVISGEERDRVLRILEQAGFGHTQISDADAELVRGLLTRRT